MSRVLPGVAPQSASKPSTAALKLIPTTADTIPQNVLSAPIIGEFRRYDGVTAPAGWSLAQGQTLPIAQNPKLYGVLGTIAGGDGKTTFALPKPGFEAIIAVAGSAPSSPQTASAGRNTSTFASLGPGAVPALRRTRQPSARVTAELAAERRLMMNAVRVGGSSPVPVPAELANRYGQAVTDARSAALGQLGPASRERLDAAVDAAVSGRTNLYAAVATMTATLTAAESDALLGVNDALVRPFNPSASSSRASSDARSEAAHFLISVAVTHEQAKAIFELERNRHTL